MFDSMQELLMWKFSNTAHPCTIVIPNQVVPMKLCNRWGILTGDANSHRNHGIVVLDRDDTKPDTVAIPECVLPLDFELRFMDGTICMSLFLQYIESKTYLAHGTECIIQSPRWSAS